MNRKNSIPSPVGGSALLVIFTVLCLTIFALLALATVKADIRLAKDSKDAVEQYYKADYEAEKILAKLRRGQEVEDVLQDGNIYCYDCKISDTQVLSVVVEITNGTYHILQWKEISTVEWEPEEYIDVYDGEMIILD